MLAQFDMVIIIMSVGIVGMMIGSAGIFVLLIMLLWPAKRE